MYVIDSISRDVITSSLAPRHKEGTHTIIDEGRQLDYVVSLFRSFFLFFIIYFYNDK